MNRTTKAMALGLLTATTLFATSAQAAEVRLLSSAGIKPVIDAVKPAFERATGHKLMVKYVLTPQVAKVAEAGEVFDVAITTPAHIAEIMKQIIVPDGCATNLAKFDLGRGVRAGGSITGKWI
jgi:molybdate transport system substrate-binding protein